MAAGVAAVGSVLLVEVVPADAKVGPAAVVDLGAVIVASLHKLLEAFQLLDHSGLVADDVLVVAH